MGIMKVQNTFYEPGNSNNYEALLASHSCAFCNSIRLFPQGSFNCRRGRQWLCKQTPGFLLFVNLHYAGNCVFIAGAGFKSHCTVGGSAKFYPANALASYSRGHRQWKPGRTVLVYRAV